MPSIDVHVVAGLFSEDSEQVLARELAQAALRAEGLEPAPFLLEKSWVFFHRYAPSAVLTGAGTPAQHPIRIQILTPYNRLRPEVRADLVREVSAIVNRVTGDPTQSERTFVLISETADGGWGLAGFTGAQLVEWATAHAAADRR